MLGFDPRGIVGSSFHRASGAPTPIDANDPSEKGPGGQDRRRWPAFPRGTRKTIHFASLLRVVRGARKCGQCFEVVINYRILCERVICVVAAPPQPPAQRSARL